LILKKENIFNTTLYSTFKIQGDLIKKGQGFKHFFNFLFILL